MTQAVKTMNGFSHISEAENVIKVEPSHRWIRVQFNDEYIADSKRVLLVWEKRHAINYYFPIADVRMDLLEKGRSGSDSNGKQYWNHRVGDRSADSIAWNYSSSVDDEDVHEGYLAFNWNKMDHWYEEDEEVFVHPRDPYHRVDTIASSRRVRIELDGVTLADTTRPYLLFETGLPVRHYIPQEDVNMDLLESSPASTTCPYKGGASYWSINLGDKVHRNYVWGYLNPIPEAGKIAGLLSFYNEKVNVFIDGELQEKAESLWS